MGGICSKNAVVAADVPRQPGQSPNRPSRQPSSVAPDGFPKKDNHQGSVDKPGTGHPPSPAPRLDGAFGELVPLEVGPKSPIVSTGPALSAVGPSGHDVDPAAAPALSPSHLSRDQTEEGGITGVVPTTPSAPTSSGTSASAPASTSASASASAGGQVPRLSAKLPSYASLSFGNNQLLGYQSSRNNKSPLSIATPSPAAAGGHALLQSRASSFVYSPMAPLVVGSAAGGATEGGTMGPRLASMSRKGSMRGVNSSLGGEGSGSMTSFHRRVMSHEVLVLDALQSKAAAVGRVLARVGTASPPSIASPASGAAAALPPSGAASPTLLPHTSTASSLAALAVTRQRRRGEVHEEDSMGTSALMSSLRGAMAEPSLLEPASSDASGFLSSFPKTDEEKHLLRQALSRNFITSGLSKEESDKVIDAFRPLLVRQGEALVTAGEKSDVCYIAGIRHVNSGSSDGVKVIAAALEIVASSGGADEEKEIVPAGFLVGEEALLNVHRGSAVTIKAVSASAVQDGGSGELALQDDGILQVYSLDRLTFKRTVLASALASIEENKRILKQVSLFAGFDEGELSRLASDVIQRVTFLHGARIIQEGDVGGVFYVVCKGAVRIVKEKREDDQSAGGDGDGARHPSPMVAALFGTSTTGEEGNVVGISAIASISTAASTARGAAQGLSASLTRTEATDDTIVSAVDLRSLQEDLFNGRMTPVTGEPSASNDKDKTAGQLGITTPLASSRLDDRNGAPISTPVGGDEGGDDEDEELLVVDERGMRPNEVELQSLGEGCFFGEQSLLQEGLARSFSAIAQSEEVTVLAISKDDFLALFGPLREHKERRPLAVTVGEGSAKILHPAPLPSPFSATEGSMRPLTSQATPSPTSVSVEGVAAGGALNFFSPQTKAASTRLFAFATSGTSIPAVPLPGVPEADAAPPRPRSGGYSAPHLRSSSLSASLGGSSSTGALAGIAFSGPSAMAASPAAAAGAPSTAAAASRPPTYQPGQHSRSTSSFGLLPSALAGLPLGSPETVTSNVGALTGIASPGTTSNDDPCALSSSTASALPPRTPPSRTSGAGGAGAAQPATPPRLLGPSSSQDYIVAHTRTPGGSVVVETPNTVIFTPPPHNGATGNKSFSGGSDVTSELSVVTSAHANAPARSPSPLGSPGSSSGAAGATLPIARLLALTSSTKVVGTGAGALPAIREVESPHNMMRSASGEMASGRTASSTTLTAAPQQKQPPPQLVNPVPLLRPASSASNVSSAAATSTSTTGDSGTGVSISSSGSRASLPLLTQGPSNVAASSAAMALLLSSHKGSAVDSARSDKSNETGKSKEKGEQTAGHHKSQHKQPAKPRVELEDLEKIAILGEGAFGLVKLVRHKHSGEVFAMKQMSKKRIVDMKQVGSVLRERRILEALDHPFIVRYLGSYKDARNLYLLQEYAQGGDFFSLLIRNGGTLSISQSVYYAAVVAVTVDYMHRSHVVYRDLKPENLLLSRSGHLKLADLGFAKTLAEDGRTYTLCGTPEYLAPELIVSSKGHSWGVDWWALGILLYEMLCGFSPFADPSGAGDQVTIYKAVLRGKLRFPSAMRDPNARDIITRLLQPNVSQRLGCLKDKGKDVLKHAFFAGRISWGDLLKGKIPPPIKPPVGKDLTDHSCFEKVDDVEEEGSKATSTSAAGAAYSPSMASKAGYSPDWDRDF